MQPAIILKTPLRKYFEEKWTKTYQNRSEFTGSNVEPAWGGASAVCVGCVVQKVVAVRGVRCVARQTVHMCGPRLFPLADSHHYTGGRDVILISNNTVHVYVHLHGVQYCGAYHVHVQCIVLFYIRALMTCLLISFFFSSVFSSIIYSFVQFHL